MSVIICCYNSGSRLHETLKHLALQNTDAALCWEIIIVDNASTDNTVLAAKQAWQQIGRNSIDFKIVHEPQQGLSYARQRGVAEAGFEYILFCDDDNWLNEDYVQTALGLMDQDSTIGAMGGFSTPVSDIEIPGWFDQNAEVYSTGKQGQTSGYVNERGYVCGAGMVTRKTIFNKAVNNNFPSILTDRKRTSLSGGGDVEYCLRLLLQGYNIYYSEALVFQHYIPAYRLTEEYLEALLKGINEAQLILREYFEAVKIKKLDMYGKVRLIGTAVKDLIKSLVRRTQPGAASGRVLYYIFNTRCKGRTDLAIIKHFYDYKG